LPMPGKPSMNKGLCNCGSVFVSCVISQVVLIF